MNICTILIRRPLSALIRRPLSALIRRPLSALIRRPLSALLVLSLVSCYCLTFKTISADDRVPLSHDSYDQWKSVSNRQLSADGKWFSYQTAQGWGENEQRKLWLRNIESEVEHSIPWGRGGTFTRDGKYFLFTVEPDPAVVKKAVADRIPEEQRPAASMAIMNLETKKLRTTERVRSFSLPEEGNDWVAYLVPESKAFNPQTSRESLSPELVSRPNKAGVTTLVQTLTPTAKPQPANSPKTPDPTPAATTNPPREQAPTPARGRTARPGGGQGGGQGASGGTATSGGAGSTSSSATNILVVEQLSSGMQWRFPNVTEFRFDKTGKSLAWVVRNEKTSDVWLTNLTLPITARYIISAPGSYSSLVFDQAGSQLAFVHQTEAEGKKPADSTVYRYQLSQIEAPQVVIDGKTPGIPEGWSIQLGTPVSFSKSGRRLFINTSPKASAAEEEPNAATNATPTATLDLWHWSEPLLQTVQQVQVNRLRRLNYRAVLHLESNTLVQLAQPETPAVVIADEDDSLVGLMVSNERYQVERTWESPSFSDVWLVNIETGMREQVLERTQNSVQISPAGNYLYWWDGTQQHWFAMSVKNKRIVNLSEQIPHSLVDAEHDTPMLPPSYGTAGWIEKDQALWLQDRYDLWRVDPTGKQPPVCVTRGVGRERQIRFRRIRLDSEERSLPGTGKHLLSAFAEANKSTGYFELQVNRNGSEINELILVPEAMGDLLKAKDSDTVVVTRQDFRRFPDNWKTDLKFQTFQRLSKVNPQQNQYRWGSAELVRWNSQSGQSLAGIVYKPDNFDPNYKYPLIVYYYERNSDTLHRYHAPVAGRSTINFSFYVSRGYVVFVPDIVYQAGTPGQSAMQCVMPGVDHLIQQGYIDEQRMGLQGHSWGGYQTAYLVSQTDRFAAAEAGAPVSNMTSAYGGIRWESGLSRMFQYERTQSRIGQTLWENREAYIENSPLFFADRIRTPLLILHNDQDGAVPWYQGIELFMALRRLERPAWLVNYNGEPHGIAKEENRRDFAIRMQQFFDHYLQDAPPAKWMVSGIPATEKGKDYGLELVSPPSAATTATEEKPAPPTRRNRRNNSG